VPPPDATEKYFLPASIISFFYVPGTGGESIKKGCRRG